MEDSFQSGFFAAQGLSYLAAAGYFLWAGRRKHPERGTRPMGVLFLNLLVLAVCDVAVTSGAGFNAVWLGTFDVLAHGCAPLALILAVRSVQKTPGPQPRALYAAGLMVAFFAAGYVASHGALSGAHAANPSWAVTLANLTNATLGAICLWFLGRGLLERRGLGPVPFFGGCALVATLIHDAIGSQGVVFSGLGYGLFSLSLFGDRVARFTQRRDVLVVKTADLARKSDGLTKAFRELRAAQNELVRKEQLAAMGELSAVVAHEVRNPLAVITNAVATLRRSETTADNREVLLEILAEETSRLNSLVGDLLRYARPLAVERSQTKLRELLDKALGAVSSRPNIIVRVDDRSGLITVRADPHLLRQALDNIIHNAVQAMPEGGTLSVTLREAKGEVKGLELLVGDTGNGMDTAVRKRALDPFFTTRPSGTGLGLAIVARVVDAHAGRLRIFSEPELGTEVHVFLPEDPDDGPPPSRARLLPPVVEPFPDVTDERRSA